MDKLIRPGRVFTLFLIFVLIIGLYATSMYDLQVVQGSDYYAIATGTSTTTTTVSAARGALLDRNGTMLASSVTSYNVGITRGDLMSAEDPNQVLLDMIYFTLEHGQTYTDTMPITISPPFTYTTMSEIQRYRLQTYLEYMDLAANISASDLFIWLKEHYGIDYTTSLKDARLIIGLRYELEMRLIVNINPYIFVEDASSDFVAAILEMNFPGVHITKTSKRQYHTDYAAHLLGYVGYMNEEEYEYYEQFGYGMNTYIGKSGVEAAFEQYLHGTDGEIETTRNENGEIIDQRVVSEAVAGANVYLTIDIGLQQAAENALYTTIQAINTAAEESTEDEDGDGVPDPVSKATGGSVVAIEVGTGNVLALANYPTFNPSTFLEDYNDLVNDPTNPLYNRATMGLYNPGSTFKPVTALTALHMGVIDPNSTIVDEGVYTKYADMGLWLYCWIYPDNHGAINVVQALSESCNYFFYTVGLECGPTAIAATAEGLGLGEPTGIEIEELTGNRATIEYKAETIDGEHNDWYDADTLMDAIGQSFNYYTTLQLANYAATIASGGNRYSLTLLDFVSSSDYSSVIFQNQPQLAHQMTEYTAFFPVITEGMVSSGSTGTGSRLFSDYKVTVATKTGTTQSDATTTNSGIFICFAPAEDPEIAIAVTVENGKSGSTIMTVAKEMLDYYFSDSFNTSYPYENVLLP